MKKTFANLFLKIYASQGGNIMKWLTGLMVGAIVAVLTKISGKEPSPETIIAITTITTLSVTTVIGDFVTKVQIKYGTEVQQITNQTTSRLVPDVKVDGWLGPQSMDALKDMSTSVNVMAAPLSRLELSAVKAEVVNVKTATSKLDI